MRVLLWPNLALALASCAAPFQLYAGQPQGASQTAIVDVDELDGWLQVEEVRDATGRDLYGRRAVKALTRIALLPGRYRIVLRPQWRPTVSYPRIWAVDVDLDGGRTYTVVIGKIVRACDGRGCQMASAVHLVDDEDSSIRAAGVPLQEAKPFPPGDPVQRDPAGPRCAAGVQAPDCTPLPIEWLYAETWSGPLAL